MKETRYFLSGLSTWSNLQAPLNSVIDSRNDFFDKNKDDVEEIESEKIEFIPVQNGSHVYAMLTISYFLKKL